MPEGRSTRQSDHAVKFVAPNMVNPDNFTETVDKAVKGGACVPDI
jgi:hypothetical protein